MYHCFPIIEPEVRKYEEEENRGIIPEHYESLFDIHQLIADGPRGMDPCMSFN